MATSFQGQDLFDVIIILTLTFFTIRGYLNGFVGEVAAIVSLVGGFWVAHNFHGALAPALTFLPDELWRNMAAYVILFIAVLLLVAVLARVLQRILTFAFVDWANSLGGGILGLIKGLILCSLVFMIMNKLIPNVGFYKQSHMRPYFEIIINQVRTSLPANIVKKFDI